MRFAVRVTAGKIEAVPTHAEGLPVLGVESHRKQFFQSPSQQAPGPLGQFEQRGGGFEERIVLQITPALRGERQTVAPAIFGVDLFADQPFGFQSLQCLRHRALRQTQIAGHRSGRSRKTICSGEIPQCFPLDRQQTVRMCLTADEPPDPLDEGGRSLCVFLFHDSNSIDSKLFLQIDTRECRVLLVSSRY